MPSGKQILSRVLHALSQGVAPSPTGPEISDRLRASFLLHGSTASESWRAIDGIEWLSEKDDQGNVVRQGIAYDGVFLSDLFEELSAPTEVPENIRRKHPQLSPQPYQEATRFMWLILSSVQWFDCLAPAEGEGDISTEEELLANYIKKLRHFRQHPEDFD